MYALASRWRRLGTAALPVAFACCVRRLLLAKGSDVRPGVALASSGHRRSAGSICVLCAALAACQGVRCTPGVALASSGRRRSAGGICVLCAALGARQGVGCTPWRRAGVVWAPTLCRWHLRAVCGACCLPRLPRGRMYAPGVALASSGHRRSAGSICAPCAALAACQGVGCTPWRRAGVVWAPPLCR